MPPHLLAAVSLPWGLLGAFVGGVLAGMVVNWATYSLAWNRRAISPWSRPDDEAPHRRTADRVPILGWWGLRRESTVHGRRFWVRPMAVEFLMGAIWACLYWWEVDRQGLIAEQLHQLLPIPRAALPQAPWSVTAATFLSHALLASLMMAASLIDVDEKTIPDGITVPGTLLGLTLAALAPMSLLPQVAVRAQPELASVLVMPLAAGAAADHDLYLEPVTLAAPNQWPAALAGARNGLGLAVGLACFAVWRLALTTRIWRGRRGMGYGLRVMSARVARDLRHPVAFGVTLAGVVAISTVWFLGGAPWVGLLTALVGLLGCGSMIWAVRIVGSAAMRREAMGFGDVTLMMMIGTFLGWQAGIFIFFLAPFAGLVVGVAQLLLRRDDVIPYGPFLCLGTAAVAVRWAHFWNSDPGGLQPLFGVPWLVPGVLAIGVVMLGAMLVLWRNIKEAVFRHPTGE